MYCIVNVYCSSPKQIPHGNLALPINSKEKKHRHTNMLELLCYSKLNYDRGTTLVCVSIEINCVRKQ